MRSWRTVFGGFDRWAIGHSAMQRTAQAAAAGSINMTTVYLIRVVAMPRVDAIKGLRRGLKYLKRACGLRCISIQEIPAQAGIAPDRVRQSPQEAKET
jgi:hypothetical protein